MLGIADADTAENSPESPHCVITPLSCTVPRRPGDPSALHDLHPVRLAQDSRLRSIYGVDTIQVGHFCNYGVNPEYLPRFEAAGLRIAALGASGDLRAVELPGHPFFVATLFHPQLQSQPGSPSPFVIALVNAARARLAAA